MNLTLEVFLSLFVVVFNRRIQNGINCCYRSFASSLSTFSTESPIVPEHSNMVRALNGASYRQYFANVMESEKQVHP